jgi:hypothetical protein
MNKVEHFVADVPNELVWLRFKRLTNSKLCLQLLNEKQKRLKTSLDNHLIQRKATGLASVVDSGLGYWEQNNSRLNSWVLSRYYALLQMTIAEQVASVKTSDDLTSVQKHTESGHGLAIRPNPKDFPSDFLIHIIKNGHFYSYEKFLGIPVKSISYDKKIRKEEDITNPSLLISLKDLFRRIPELQPIILEYFNEPSLSFHVSHAFKNTRIELTKKRETNLEGFFQRSNNDESEADKLTYVNIWSHDANDISVDELNRLGLPIFDIELVEDISTKKLQFEGKIKHPSQGHWWQYISLYRSSYCGTSIIAPVFNEIKDVVTIHLMLLYGLSIIVRYLPDWWYEITNGELSIYSSLIEHYLTIFDRVIPKLMLERITEVDLNVSYPGSLTAPI